MYLKFVLSLSLLFCTIGLTLQAETNDNATISGKVLDAKSQKNLDLVSIHLFKKESSELIKTVVSDANGLFSFRNLPSGKYHLQTKFLGYAPQEFDVDLNTGQQTNVGEISLTISTHLLNEVEVTALKSNMRLDVDKRIFSVNQNIATAGASASDILKDIPSVDVDGEGTISLRSSSSVTVWINGKPSGLTADNRAQVLEQMPAESIDRVEVITNPSSKFSPEGSAGIINIVLKKNRKSGYYGSVSAGVSHPWGKNLGANINYNNSKIEAYANIGLRNDANHGSGSSKRQTYAGSDTTYMNSDSKRTFEMNGLFMRGGIDYHLTDKHTFSLSGFSMNGSHNFNSDNAYDFLNNQRIIERQRVRSSDTEAAHKNFELSMDYLWEIGDEHSLKINTSFGKRNDDNKNSYVQNDLDASGHLIKRSVQRQNGPSDGNGWEFQADYTRKINDNSKFEAGLKSDINTKYSVNKVFNSATTNTPDVSNGFNFDEKIHAAYATYTSKINRFGYQLGLRGEQNIQSFVSTDLRTAVALPKDRNYFNLFPTLFLNYNFSKNSDIQLNYSKRINRPRGRSLNPFVDLSDSSNIRTGNPELKPELADAFELNFIQSWEKHTISTSLYHRITKDVIQDILYIDNGIMYQKPSNVTGSISSGVELIAKDKLSKILETTTTINMYYSQMDAFDYRNVHYKGTDGFSWNAKVNGNLVFSKSLSGQISGSYNAPRIIAQGKSKGSYSMDLGLRKSFMENKLQLSLNARNLLNSMKMESKTWGEGFYQESSNQFFGRNVRLNLTWNFGNLKPKKKPGKDANSDANMDMGGEF